MINPKFIHLRMRSEYSIFDGLNKLNELIKKASMLKMPALAITDFTNLFGLFKFYNTSYFFGIKPIIGADFFLKESFLDKKFFNLTILAKNNIGYKNLILLITKAHKYGSGNNLFILRSWLKYLNDGLILLSGGLNGDIGSFLLLNNKKLVKECLLFYNKYFFNHYYIEIIRTDRLNEELYLNLVINLARYYKLPIVATNDIRFISASDFEIFKIKFAINNKFSLNIKNKLLDNYSSKQYLRTEKEMIDLFKDLPDALLNSVEISRRCNVILDLNKYFLPKFYTNFVSVKDYLINVAFKGFKEKFEKLFLNNIKLFKDFKIYCKRLIKELKIIYKMKFSSYFLIVMDFIIWAKNNNIPVGPGRGSGSSSLVAYFLKITNIDPIKFNLLFERFLNSERLSMPDFDIDFCMKKRDLVIEYVIKKYGINSVAQIITFGTMSAKSVIRDVGRVLGYPYNFINYIAKLIPKDIGITLKNSFVLSSKLLNFYNTDVDVKIIIDISLKLEGVIRNIGKHAGGIVIAPYKIFKFIPLYYDVKNNYPITQFDKYDLEYSGLIKFDFLGLRTLTIIYYAVKNINIKLKKKKLNIINIDNIPLNDKKSFNLLNKLNTTAIFQLESVGMKDLIKRLKPDLFEDIISLIALFRPGPLKSGMVDNFINRKCGKEIISYPHIIWQHDLLKPILKKTYGVIIFQEQVMQIAQVLAGYSLGKADILCKAMSKKQPKEMLKQRLIFEKGTFKKGIDKKLSMKIFDFVEKFAGYGFNRSHSVAYAYISYQTLWLKANFFADFMASVMSADIDNIDKISKLVCECLNMNIKILPPNINYSNYYFYVNDNNCIVYGLGAIKGVGKIVIDSIINARNIYGKFNKFIDLFMRIDIKKINKRILEKLIMSGSLDFLGFKRYILLGFSKSAFKIINQYLKYEIIGQKDIFGLIFNDIEKNLLKSKIIKSLSMQEILNKEYESLGLYLTMHPLDKYIYEIKYCTKGVRILDLLKFKDNFNVSFIGLIEYIRVFNTKNNNQICICTLDDKFNKIDIVLFNNIYNKYKYLLKKNIVIFVNGYIKYNKYNNVNKVIVNYCLNITQLYLKFAKKFLIYLFDNMLNKQFLNKLFLLLKFYCFNLSIPVFIYYNKNGKLIQLNYVKNFKITPTDNFLNRLSLMIGNKNFKFVFN